MRRVKDENSELPGEDSFLDIVANVVGILILLVMVFGLRAARQLGAEPTPERVEQVVAAEPAEPEVSNAELDNAVQLALAKHGELQAKAAKAIASRIEVNQRDSERVELTTLVARVEQEIEERRQKMDEQQRRDFDLQAKIGAAQHELENLSREQIALVTAEPEVEQIESLPTPLAMTVSKDELHVRLARGHAKVIPLDDLIRTARGQAEENLWRLNSRDSATITVGPVDGFRMHFQLRKFSFRSSRGSGSYVGSGGWKLEPAQEPLGEPVADAVREESQFLATIGRLSRGKKPTVTIWTYPDSFNDFRELKKVLFQKGFQVAGRPLPEGVPIGGSPSGSKSAAQ